MLDEADEMLDMGFREDLQFILETTPADRRTLLFSATLPKAIVTLATHYQKDALRIATRADTTGHADIEYRAIRVAGNKIEGAVVNLLRFLDPPGALVFCNTRNAVRHMEAQLTERGFSCVALSGELSQSERNHALQALRDGRARVCVATDVAARGIDLPGLNLVIHAELPNDAQVLQHRSGRTGRAGKKGVSVLLVPPSRRRRAEEMLGRARVNAAWGNAPSADDIRKVDQQRLLENPLLVEPGTDDDLAMAEELLKTHSPQQLAAAFVKMYRAGLPAPEEIEEEVSYQQSHTAPREHQGRKPREDRQQREPKPNDHRPREPRSSEQRERPHKTNERQHAPTHERGAAPGEMANGVWFRLNVGRERNADPKWLLPEICRQGEVTKKDVGAIRVSEMETLFQIAPEAAPKFTILVSERKKGGVRISPALDQTGQSTARPREKVAQGDQPGDAPPHKPGFNKKKFGGKKFGKPGGYKGKKPNAAEALEQRLSVRVRQLDFHDLGKRGGDVAHVDLTQRAVLADPRTRQDESGAHFRMGGEIAMRALDRCGSDRRRGRIGAHLIARLEIHPEGRHRRAAQLRDFAAVGDMIDAQLGLGRQIVQQR